MELTCQADVMDRAVHGDPSPVPPCDGPRDMQRRGYWLCVGCAEAYDALCALGDSLRDRGVI